MQVVDRESPNFLYQQVVSHIQSLTKDGTLQAGDKLPSLRKLGQQFNISVPTVKQAYLELERQGIILARPQSGYYLKAKNGRDLLAIKQQWQGAQPCAVSCRSLIEKVYDAVHLPLTVPLGISNPVQVHPTDKALARLMRNVISRYAGKAVSYGPPNGDIKLRTQVAIRFQEQGTQVSPEDVVVTNGTQEALAIALKTVAKPGDVIAVESPTFFGVLELIESLNMKALEIYTSSDDGICVDELAAAIQKHEVKACLFSSAINNPLGALMSDERRQQIVQLLEQHGVPLIEDGAYNDLYFYGNAPKTFQHFSRLGQVITCSSFSKTAAPGYRIGYLISRKWESQCKQMKRALSASTSTLPQWTLSEYLSSGDYDRHLTLMRKRLCFNAERMRAAIAEYFPRDVCISTPRGGSVLWVRCRSSIDTENLFDQAIKHGVSFAPGRIFSPSGKYANYMRLSYGVEWNEKIEQAIKKLGRLVDELPPAV